MTIEIRAVTEDELDAYIDACQTAFGDEPHEGEPDRVRLGIGLDRTRAAFDGSRIVGTLGSYGLQVAVPGGADVATAGLTRVTVAATHRRQGILTAMMDSHFDDAVANGEALSALWASEVAIYGRFGYGQGSENVTMEFDSRLAGLRAPDDGDAMAMVDVTEAKKLFPAVRERSRVGRPGLYHRSDDWWDLRCLPDHEWARHGGSPRRHVVATRDGEAVGYAMYRHHRKWDDLDMPNGKVDLVEVAAVDTRAEHSLWYYLANIDLFPNVSSWTQPTDSIVPWLATNPRAVKQLVNDGIHVRVLDIVAALSARRYDVGGEVVFSTVDQHRPELTGTYRLAVDDHGRGTCTRTEAEPAVALSPYALGSLYLGAAPRGGLALQGHVVGLQADLLNLRRLFAWPVAPWCDEGF